MKNLDIVFENSDILAGFSNRFGGLSQGKFESLNLADHVGDDIQKVLQNREIFRQKIGAKKLKFMRQIHSNIVKILEDENEELGECDGVISKIGGLGICVLVADCSPVILIDEKVKLVAVLHAGRAGVISKICTKGVNLMREKFACRDIKAFVGANIKARNYEIGELDLGEFNRYKIGKNFDINAALKDEFLELGIKEFSFDSRCTFESDELFSYRKSGVTGRFCAFAMIKEKHAL
ncbi:MAG: polyphenol oxidase family protein [Campylobacter sp.]|nr:polyphenol oxidase family protein [Campylobacter sp.]